MRDLSKIAVGPSKGGNCDQIGGVESPYIRRRGGQFSICNSPNPVNYLDFDSVTASNQRGIQAFCLWNRPSSGDYRCVAERDNELCTHCLSWLTPKCVNQTSRHLG